MQNHGQRQSDLAASLKSWTRRVLDARAFTRILKSSDFEDAFLECSDTALAEVKKILDSGKVAMLKTWLEQNKVKNPNAMSYRQLRELAKQHNIPRWSRLDRQELEEALRGIQLQTGKEPA